MWQLTGKAWQGLRRRPWLAVVCILVVGLASYLIFLDFWAKGRYAAANKSLNEENFAEARAYLEECQAVWWWQSADTYFLAARLERLLGNYFAASALLDKSNYLRGRANEAAEIEAMLLRAETGYVAQVELPLMGMVDKNHKESQYICRTLAKIYILQWRYPAALTALQRWLAVKPNSAEALEWRGLMWERMKNNALAEKDFRQSLAIAPHRRQARLSLVQVLLHSGGQPKEILEHVNYLLEKEPNRPEYLLALAQCQALQGNMPAARQVLDQLLQLEPDNAAALYTRADLEIQDGQFAAAEKWARKAIAVEPPEFKAYSILAESLKRQDNPLKEEEAKIHEKKFLAYRDDTFRLAHLLSGQFENKKNNPDIWTEIGDILLRAHKYKEGVKFLEGALATSPDHPAANHLLAQYYTEKNQPEAAAKYQKLGTGGSKK